MKANYFRLWLALLMAMLCPRVHAGVTVQDDWRLGENDPGAVVSDNCTQSVDSVGGRILTNTFVVVGSGGSALTFYPFYVGSVSSVASTTVGSSLGLSFGPGLYGQTTVISNLTDNFGLELWMNPTASGTSCLVYNGNTGSSGWGLYLVGTNFCILFGGVSLMTAAIAPLNTWTHLALVRDNGVTTLYTNGVAAFSGNSYAPIAPAGSFLMGANNGGTEAFTGALDEVRVFTFAPGQFNPTDLLCYEKLLEGPAAGSDSVGFVYASGQAWTATTAAGWLHPVNTSGTGSATVNFTFTANTNNAARTGLLNIGIQPVAITQAGASYLPATAANLVHGILINDLAVDEAGNVYFTSYYTAVINAVSEWRVSGETVTTFISSGLYGPFGVAVDRTGNVYIADTGNGAIKEWHISGGTVTILVSSNLNQPYGVAVDGTGNVYIADTYNSAIKEWHVSDGTVTTLVSSGLSNPNGVAVDGVGNVYIADTDNSVIKEWHVSDGTVTTLISSGLNTPLGVAVDGAGNVYIADTGDRAVKEWHVSSGNVTTLALVPFGVVGFGGPTSVAVDGAGDVYIADYNNAIIELPRTYVDSTPRYESSLAGSNALPVTQVLPDTANLTGVFAPVSDSSWLSITDVTNGVVSYAFTANTDAAVRVANLSLLGQSLAVIQFPAVTLGITNLLEGAAAGADSIVLATSNAWTAAASNSWLHLAAGYQSGIGSTNLVFTFDANPGNAPRAGTLNISGQTVTVTQAGTNYVAAQVMPLVASGLNNPFAVAVDPTGNNVYIADAAVKLWARNTNSLSEIISTNLGNPLGLAMDLSGNVYLAETTNNAIKEWHVASGMLTTVVSSGLGNPLGVAVDAADNVCLDNTFSNTIEEWHASSGNVTTLVSTGLNDPAGLAVDAAGNVYFSDFFNNVIKEWHASGGNVTILSTPVLGSPYGVAVDGSGNVYIADTGNNAIKAYHPADGSVINLVASGLFNPHGVAVDAARNVYIADTYNAAVKELPDAYVDAAARWENGLAGSDALPAVLPASVNLQTPLNPTSDQSWLTISGVANGVVSYAFTANTSTTNRTAHISLLGVAVPVTQTVIGSPPVLVNLAWSKNTRLQFAFTNNPNATFTVLASTNLALPLTNWSLVGVATNVGGNLFQFAAPLATNNPQMFYRVTSP